MNEPHIDVVRYSVSDLPLNHKDRRHLSIYVEYAGKDWWAVRDGFGMCLNKSGQWDSEMLPSSRTNAWLLAHRFEEKEALSLAKTALGSLEINGKRASELL